MKFVLSIGYYTFTYNYHGIWKFYILLDHCLTNVLL